MIRNILNGLCMALADSVPGVSGGTIAFILGFYDKFISSVNDLIYGKKESKITAIKYLLKIAIGWIIGMVLAILILSKLFEKHIYFVSSMFLGFMIFSIPLIVKEEKDILKGNYINIIFSIIGISIVTLITFLNSRSINIQSYDLSTLNIFLVIMLILSGIMAISAMVLPGISGSSLLLILGLYMPIITALKEILHLNFSYLPAILLFLVGIILGVLITIKGIKNVLEKKRSATIYTIIGLMIGSLYPIIMGPTTFSKDNSCLNFTNFNVFAFILGIFIVIALAVTKQFLERKHNKKNM